jgi:TRAP-type uncharacterized transport system fused permease subunit
LQPGGTWTDVATMVLKTGAGIIALAAAAQGWALVRTTRSERALLVLSGLLLVFPSLIEALIEPIIRRNLDYAEWIGVALGLAVVAKQWMTARGARVKAAAGE